MSNNLVNSIEKQISIKMRDFEKNIWIEKQFNNFESFYNFLQETSISDKRMKKCRSLNWKSTKIINIFLNHFNENNNTSLKRICSSLNFHTDKCFTKEFWIERGWTNPEEKVSEVQSKCGKKFSEKIKKDKSIRITNTNIEWYLNKGYSLEESNNLLKDRQKTFSLDTCIKKYGKEKGLEIFRKRQEKWQKSLYENNNEDTMKKWRFFGKASKKSNNLFSKYYEMLCEDFNCFLSKYNREYMIETNEKRYFYDFTIPDLKLIFEYNGSHVHANPKWPEEKLKNWKNPFSNESAEENIKNYKKKILAAEQQGFTVIILWDDCKNNEDIIELEISSRLQTLLQ